MSAVKLTVITPVFNGKKYIAGCLQSVIAQGCPDVEHLILDGGSTDGTTEIIESFVKDYPHLRYLSEKDRGQASAMNKGISLARGEIIGFLNGDDFYEPGVLARVINLFQRLPEPSFAVGNCNILGREEKIIYLNRPNRLSFTNMLIGGDKHQFPFNPAAYFYHKSLHDKIGFYNENDHYMMDVDFILRAVRSAHVHYVDETWGNFRNIPGTKTFSLSENNRLEPDKKKLMDVYLKTLPWPRQAWILFLRFLYKGRISSYYADRLQDLFPRKTQKIKNPLSISTEG